MKEMKWIPVSDHLPEPEGHKEYLVTIAHYDPKNKKRFVIVTEYEARFEIPYWDDIPENGPARVVAWMPLPEPYTEPEINAEVTHD